MKLTLLRKGLLLVSIPLCFEITIFAVLINLQDQVEREAQRINRNKKINDRVNLILRDGMMITDAMQLYDQSLATLPALNKTLHSKMVAERISAIRDSFQALKELAHDDPVVLNHIKSCATGMDLALQDIRMLRTKIRSASFDELGGIIQETKQRLDQHLNIAVRSGMFQLAEKSARATDDVPSERIREQISVLLKCALGLSALFALIGAILLSKHLAGRLSQLSDNANRLAAGKPLLAPLGGSDEVAELDRNFHYAAELIEGAKRMRHEVTAMITHDLKTPLQTVRSYLEMIEDGRFGGLNTQGVKLLAITQNASDHMVDLIENVLQLEKLRTGTIQLQTTTIKLAPLLDKCLNAVKLLAVEKQVVLVDDYNRSTCESVDADEFWLGQVFVNILGNAIKFAPQNSTVSVSAQREKDNVEIRITDSGPGIPQEHLKLIFDRFHRVQSTASVAGTGLGLPIAKELIELHQGSISVESEVGKGSTFAIRLPLSKDVVTSGG